MPPVDAAHLSLNGWAGRTRFDGITWCWDGLVNIKVGAVVLVPLLSELVPAQVVEILGDPPSNLRVQLLSDEKLHEWFGYSHAGGQHAGRRARSGP